MVSVIANLQRAVSFPHTTSAIGISWQAATIESIEDTIFQPASLELLPPTKIVMYATMHASSSTTAKFMKNPVLLHIEQKLFSSPWQSSDCGNLVHSPVIELQRLCRPYVTRIGSWSVGDVYEIQLGSAMEAMVHAAAPRNTQSEIPYTILLVIVAGGDAWSFRWFVSRQSKGPWVGYVA